VQLTERLIRSEVDALKKYNLISTTKTGMLLTAEGLETLIQLGEILEEHNYLFDLQNKLAEELNILSCSIVPGDLDKDFHVLSEMADKTVEVINHLLDDKEQIIA